MRVHTFQIRAARTLAPWNVVLAPTAEVSLPGISMDAGLIDDGALNEAAWGSTRLERTIIVDGGSSPLRRSVANAITERGGAAEPGSAGRRLRLSWLVKK